MGMMDNYLWAQIFTITSYVMLGFSYLVIRRRYIVICSLGMVILGGIAYLFLSAWTGLAMCGVAFVRNLYLLYDVEKHGRARKWRLRDFLSLAIFMILIIVATIPTYTEPLSAMSAVATVLYTLSLWQKKPIMYKVLGIPSCVAQVIYHVFIWNLSGIVLEGLVLVVSIIGLGLDVERRRKARKK